MAEGSKLAQARDYLSSSIDEAVTMVIVICCSSRNPGRTSVD